jgi:hypothetical protein
MSQDGIAVALQSWLTPGDPARSRVILFEKVRDMPFRYPSSREPEEVLRQHSGSNSGKHYLLGELLRRQGTPVRHMICSHRFNDSDLPFPGEMQELLRKNEIVDLHDYLQIQVDGHWIDVDATWGSNLREYGFPVTEDWDGRSPMLVAFNSEEHELIEGDPAKVKEELLSKLSPRQRKLRDQFLAALSAWIEEISAEAGEAG